MSCHYIDGKGELRLRLKILYNKNPFLLFGFFIIALALFLVSIFIIDIILKKLFTGTRIHYLSPFLAAIIIPFPWILLFKLTDRLFRSSETVKTLKN